MLKPICIRSATAAVALVTALCLAGTASAQAPLGLSINPTQGIRGDVVNAQVNTADIAANCPTQAEVTSAFQAIYDQVNDNLFTYCPDLPDVLDYECLAAVYLALGGFGIGLDFPPGTQQAAYELAHVLTFADIATQEPVGETSTFDPTTGMGSVVVPDITPGPWAVAAACVLPDLALFDDALPVVGAKLEADGRPLSQDLPPDTIDYIMENATELFQPLVAFQALGIQLFTIQTPTLGFTIDPTEGLPGEIVNGQVDTDDIDEYCVTDLTEFEARFAELLSDPDLFNAGGVGGALFDRFFPTGDFDYESCQQLSYGFTGIVTGGIASNLFGSAEEALPQTFVMTFADIATQEPVGEMGNFDPDTGEGSVVVPDVDPGLWAVAATCVGPSFDIDTLEAGIRENGDYLEGIGMPCDGDINSPEFAQFIEDVAGEGANLFDFLMVVGPTLIENIVTPDALGIQLFTVLAHLGDFQCYRAHPTVGVGAGTAGSLIPESLPVTLEDRYGVYSGTAHRPVDLCAPADKNGEDPEAPDSGDFLSSYKLSVPGPVEQVSGVQATNQFGSITLNLLQPDTLLVPSAASVEGPPAPGQSFLNDFTCYSVQVGKSKGKGKGAPTPGSVMVQTAFETVEVEPGNPQRLCVPASKNGGPVIASAPENLLCYDVKSGNDLKPAPEVFVANQFGQEVQRIGQRRELCVPTDLTE
jgi:hypothetical protein